jgi:hypothetical protein
MSTRRQCAEGSPHDRPRATVAQLQDDIDSGLTGDKVAAVDHAAAPLGTDEEAAGTPVSGEIAFQARQYERSKADRGESAARMAPVMGFLIGLVLIGLILVVAIVLSTQ